MEYIRCLQAIEQDDFALVGGKAANLGILIRADLPVPPGFVILTGAYSQFLIANGIQTAIVNQAEHINSREPDAIEQSSRSIRQLIDQGTMLDEIACAICEAYAQMGEGAVAVRSSATSEDLPGASFAGQQESYLNIEGAEEVLMAVKRCWSSLWTARAIAYRAQQGIEAGGASMAVVVQRMIPAGVAGILFTANPVNGSQDEMMIEASWGLGEAIVGGRVTPDTIVVEKATGEIRQTQMGEKSIMTVPITGGTDEIEVDSQKRARAALSSEQIGEIVRTGCKVEALFGIPQDIEWAIAGEKLYVLQARPITTQPAKRAVSVRQEELSVPGDDAWDKHGTVEIHDYDLWTRTNIGENFLEPITPLSETLWPAFFVLGRLPSREERGPGSPPLPTLGERFYGRMYVNEGAVIDGAIKRGIPTSFIDTTWGSSGRGLRSSDDTIHFFRVLGSIPSLIGSIVRAGKQRPKTPRKAKQKTPRLTSEQLYAQIDEWVEQFQQEDVRQLDDRALWNFVPLWIERGKALRPILLNAGLAGIAFYFLERRVSKWTGKRGQASVLVQALSGVYTAEIGAALWRMAQALREAHLDEIVQNYPAREAQALLQERPEAAPFMSELQAFLMRHGFRCSNDAELHNARWAEDIGPVFDMLKSYLRLDETANPVNVEQRRQQEREETTARITARLNPFRRAIFRWLLKQAQSKVRLRDNNRSYIAKFLYPMRLLMVELGRRWMVKGWLADADAIFFLTLYEIDDLLHLENEPEQEESARGLMALIAARRTAFDYWHTIIPPSALGPGGVPLPDPEPDGAFLQGLPGSAGNARGPARLIWSINEMDRLTSGDILVTQGTDPGWTPIFPLVSGLVLEVGGLLSHGAIVAREYGIPTVINVPGAMSRIQDGQLITVDGNTGKVFMDESATGTRTN